MARKSSKAMSAGPADRKEWVAMNALEQVTLKELRKSAMRTQEELACALGIGQGAISRLEKSSDMLLSTLRHYVECVGGRLEMVATFPKRPPLIIRRLDKKSVAKRKAATQAREDKLLAGATSGSPDPRLQSVPDTLGP